MIVLLLLSLGAAALVWWLHRHFEGSPPLYVVLAELVGIPMALGLLAIPFALQRSSGFDAIFFMQAALSACSPAMLALSLSAPSGFAEYFSGILFDPRDADPDGFQFARAKARAVQNDVTGALREYRSYFEQNPKRPAPLFAGAAYAERKGEFSAAAGFYREIMIKFEKQKPIWAEAGLRLAALYREKLDEPAAARKILREIATRVPRLEPGKTAAVLLSRFRN